MLTLAQSKTKDEIQGIAAIWTDLAIPEDGGLWRSPEMGTEGAGSENCQVSQVKGRSSESGKTVDPFFIRSSGHVCCFVLI